MTIKRMDHVRVVVDDLPAAVAFFGPRMGHGRLELTKFRNPTLVEIEPAIAPPKASSSRWPRNSLTPIDSQTL
jgi:hypothetical protein